MHHMHPTSNTHSNTTDTNAHKFLLPAFNVMPFQSTAPFGGSLDCYPSTFNCFHPSSTFNCLHPSTFN